MHTEVSLDNLGGVWVGDRTAADPDWKFVPTPENIKCVLPARCLRRAAGHGGSGAASRRDTPQGCCPRGMPQLPTCCPDAPPLHPTPYRYLPNLTEIQALPAGEQAAWSWALFPGNWGSPLAPQASTFYCLYDSRA